VYELLIRHNTSVSNLGKYEPSTYSDKPILTDLYHVMNSSGRISKFGYQYFFTAFYTNNRQRKMKTRVYTCILHIYAYTHTHVCVFVCVHIHM